MRDINGRFQTYVEKKIMFTNVCLPSNFHWLKFLLAQALARYKDIGTLHVFRSYSDLLVRTRSKRNFVDWKDRTSLLPFAVCVLFAFIHPVRNFLGPFLRISSVCRCHSISCSRDGCDSFRHIDVSFSAGAKRRKKKNNIVVSSTSRLTSAVSDERSSSLGRKSANWIILGRSCLGKKSGMEGGLPICFREVAA